MSRRPSISDWFGYECPYPERFRMIREAGFVGVLSFWNAGFRQPGRLSVPDMAREAGLYVENVHAPFTTINSIWLDNLDGDETATLMTRCLDDCAAFDIPTMVMHLSKSDSPPPACELGLTRIRRITDHAERMGVSVALENLRRPEYLEYVFSHIDSPRLGFCYDSGHQHCYSPGTDMLALYGARLAALHLHDNVGRMPGEDGGDRHLLPFDGTINWSAVMRSITAAGYSGPTSLEVVNLGRETMTAAEFLSAAYERAARLEALR